MGDRSGVWLRRAASPAALVTVLALLLLGVGAATAFARRAATEQAAVTVAAAGHPNPAPSTAEAAATPTHLQVTQVTPAIEPSPAAGAGPTASATPAASTSPTATETSTATGIAAAGATPAFLGTPVAQPSPPPAPTATILAPPIIQAQSYVGTGESFALHVIAPGAARVTVEMDGATYSATAVGERFWLVVGVPVAASPGPRTIRAVARNAAGAALGTSFAPLLVRPVERPVDYLELTDEQGSILTEEAGRRELTLRAQQFAQFDPAKRWVGRFVRPLFGEQTTAFGEGRSINGGPVGGFHSGMDIAADVGDPVRASAAGRVAWVGEMPIRGRAVIIDHGAGVKSGYHHLDATFVEVDALVEAGHVIGTAGSTGLSTGPHLHWEVTVWGVNVDPLQWTSASFEP